MDLKSLLSAGMALALAGCACVDVSNDERRRIEGMRRSGKTWSRCAEKGTFTPPVNMTAAVCWGLLPGAGQHFIAHKVEDAGLWHGRDSADLIELRSSGTLMLATSWFPYVYLFTLPCGIEGIIVDVNRVNNLALLKSGASPVRAVNW